MAATLKNSSKLKYFDVDVGKKSGVEPRDHLISDAPDAPPSDRHKLNLPYGMRKPVDALSAHVSHHQC